MSEIYIEELREAGEDGGGLMGYYCKGHVDRHAFAQAANRYSGATSTYDRRHVRAERSHHSWWRTVPMVGEPGQFRFVAARGPGAGAYPVTVCESIEESRLVASRREVDADRAGHRRGMAEGVQWALDVLHERGLTDAADRLLSAWRPAPEREG
ncbi:hypothetical protein ACFOGJ_15995 [Marinibaculum pumilum]|uniref:Uncharacterized protein n=1 Tax=Marinibaculum pumilum TaxID=1766165 RepID=A0ABV7L256_9PROT